MSEEPVGSVEEPAQEFVEESLPESVEQRAATPAMVPERGMERADERKDHSTIEEDTIEAIARAVTTRLATNLERLGEIAAHGQHLRQLRSANEELAERLIQAEVRARSAEKRAEDAEREVGGVYQLFTKVAETREAALPSAEPEPAPRLRLGSASLVLAAAAAAALLLPQCAGPVSITADGRLALLPGVLMVASIIAGWGSLRSPDSADRSAGRIGLFLELVIVVLLGVLFRIH